MNYKHIPTFEKCLELSKDSKFFSHSIQEKNGVEIHSFKYHLIPSIELWNEDSLNMRGITFINGSVVALPFPKFFNVGENKFTEKLSLDDMDYAIEKADGSLISMFYLGKELECKSMKSINSDVANYCREYMKTRLDIIKFSTDLLNNGYSPMFELISPINKIVLDYNGITDLYFLGARDMVTGEVCSFDKFEYGDITVPKLFKNVTDAKEYLTRDNVEGLVVTLKSGQMMKIKTEDYCRLHRILDKVTPKDIIKSIYEKKSDDLKSILATNKLDDIIKLVSELEAEYMMNYTHRIDMANEFLHNNKELSRKDIALSLKDNTLKTDVFAILSNRMDKIECSVHIDMIEKYKGK